VWQPAAERAGNDQPEDERDNKQGQKLADEMHLRESNTTNDEDVILAAAALPTSALGNFLRFRRRWPSDR
jgi:hypothetical protein